MAVDTARTDEALARKLRLLVEGMAPQAASPAHDAVSEADCSDAVARNGFCMVGSSPPMRAVFERIRRCAASDAPVLIGGESGTGKELAARAIHDHSRRASGPFVAINCAALPATLIASELFGYEKGAFTGATARKIGRLEAANGGTVFLDEIADLPLDLQGHLLRFLQEKVIERIGASTPVALDVRVIAASHVSLHEAVKRGTFRDDLFYRLHFLGLDLPPLRERGEDIMRLARFALRQIDRETHGIAHDLDASAVATILAHDWPGNVRELIACLRRAVVFANGPLIRGTDLGIALSAQPKAVAGTAGATEQQDVARPRKGRMDRERVCEALLRHGYNIKSAAKDSGIARVTMYRLIQKFGIEIVRRTTKGKPGTRM